MEHKFNFWGNFLGALWRRRNERNHQRRNRKAHTTRANKHTKAYRAERKRRNKAALLSRKINRQRARS